MQRFSRTDRSKTVSRRFSRAKAKQIFAVPKRCSSSAKAKFQATSSESANNENEGIPKQEIRKESEWTKRRFIDTGAEVSAILEGDDKELRSRLGTFYCVHQLFSLQSSQLCQSYRQPSVQRPANGSNRTAANLNTQTYSKLARKISLPNSFGRDKATLRSDQVDRPASDTKSLVAQTAAPVSLNRASRYSADKSSTVSGSNAKKTSLPVINVVKSVDEWNLPQ